MTVFLTPELKPFFGGTYFPPTSRWGRPGFPDVLGELARRVEKRSAAGRTGRGELLERLKMVTGAGRARPRRIDTGRPRRARRRRRQLREGVRPAARRLRRRAEVSAALRARCSCCGSTRAARAAGDLGQAPLRMATDTLRAMAHGRHARPHRRRLSSLLGRRRMAGPALREDAVRPGAAHARVPRGGAGDRRRLLRDGRGRHAGLRDARPDRIRRAASTRPKTPTACRRSTPAIRRRTKIRGRVLHLDGPRDRGGDGRRCGDRPAAIRHRGRRQRAAGSAGRVHAAGTSSTSRSRSTTSRLRTGADA